LFLQLCNLGLEGGNGGLILGLDSALHLLKLDLELLILALQLLSCVLILLGMTAFQVQVGVDLVDLKERGLVILTKSDPRCRALMEWVKEDGSRIPSGPGFQDLSSPGKGATHEEGPETS
jgi:hypothetical protein